MAANRSGPRYRLSDSERAWLADGTDLSTPAAASAALDLDVSPHAAEQHRDRRPDDASATIGATLATASRSHWLARHEFFHEHPDPTSAVLAAAMRTAEGTTYRMVYPVGADEGVATAYRLESVPGHCEEWGIDGAARKALLYALWGLADTGGIVDE